MILKLDQVQGLVLSPASADTVVHFMLRVAPGKGGEALKNLEAHAQRMTREGKLIAQTPLGPETADGTFFAPRAFEIDSISRLHCAKSASY